jgi:LytS/YehU family sensor histidine kinase
VRSENTNAVSAPVQSETPHLKASLELLRDSLLVAGGLTLIVTLLRDSMTGELVFRIFLQILTYTILIMFVAYHALMRVEPYVRDNDNTVQWTVFVVVMIAACALCSFLGSLMVIALKLDNEALGFLFARSFKISSVVSLMIGVNEVAFDRLKGQLEDTKSKLQEEALERERMLKLATEARLAALESRLHPHFLFNTLNSISSLIPSDPQRAERLVERIATLLRFSLEAHREGLVTVEQELKIVSAYLEIEQARLGKRLRYHLETVGDIRELQVPPLSVQTLVENSIKFAVAPNIEGGEIRIRADRTNGRLRIDVADTGAGFSLDSAPSGHGLDNLRGRLDVLFGHDAELSVARENGWTTVSMKVPV